MSRTEYTGPGVAMTPQIFEALQAASDFRDLQKSGGYQRLMTFLNERTAAALQAMRGCSHADDKIRLSYMFQWQQCEDMVDAIEDHIQAAIKLGREVIKDVDMNELQREGYAARFSTNDDDEE